MIQRNGLIVFGDLSVPCTSSVSLQLIELNTPLAQSTSSEVTVDCSTLGIKEVDITFPGKSTRYNVAFKID